jgi:hypothetical protein
LMPATKRTSQFIRWMCAAWWRRFRVTDLELRSATRRKAQLLTPADPCDWCSPLTRLASRSMVAEGRVVALAAEEEGTARVVVRAAVRALALEEAEAEGAQVEPVELELAELELAEPEAGVAPEEQAEPEQPEARAAALRELAAERAEQAAPETTTIRMRIR